MQWGSIDKGSLIMFNEVVLKRMFQNRPWRVGIVLVILLGIGVAIVWYLILSPANKSSVTGQLLREEQMIARAEASNLKSFFDQYGNAVVVESQLRSIQTPNENTIPNLQSFVKQWSKTGEVAGIALTDRNGIVIYNVTASGITQLGTSLANRDYFAWAKAQKKGGEYFVGQAIIGKFGATKDQYIVPVAAPVYRNGEFSGVLVSAVKLAVLTEHYLGQLNISDSTEVYIIGSTGYVLYNGCSPKDVGLSVYEVHYEAPFTENADLDNEIKKVLLNPKEGSLQVNYIDPKNGIYGSHLIAYSPVVLPNRNWLVALGSPAQNLATTITPTFIRQVAVCAFICLTSIIFLVIVIHAAKSRKKLLRRFSHRRL